MIKEFTIQGEPKGKARPRFGQGRTYTPKATADYEAMVGMEYKRQCGGYMFPKTDKGIEVAIIAYFGIPKSASKKRRLDMACGGVKPTKKPDADNIGKIIMDGLNGIAFEDDAHVTRLTVDKEYSLEPHVHVVIYGEADDEHT
ncbi:MAG: RusA family crossover junction endodeoxyribonuclease [Clostridia bacterium]|nr:RusA family crossover junction endodeoxyribonuclease [Clostridia bacterium]